MSVSQAEKARKFRALHERPGAFVIAMVGCCEGLRVTGSAESVGRLTTKSVVESIFLVIVLDAIFAVFFSSIGWI